MSDQYAPYVTAPRDQVFGTDVAALSSQIQAEVAAGSTIAVYAITLNTAYQSARITNLHQITDVEVTDSNGHTKSYLFQGQFDYSQGVSTTRLYVSGTTMDNSFYERVNTAGLGYSQAIISSVALGQVAGLFNAIGNVAQIFADNPYFVTPQQNCITIYQQIYNAIRSGTNLVPQDSSAPLDNPFFQSLFGGNSDPLNGNIAYREWIETIATTVVVGRSLLLLAPVVVAAAPEIAVVVVLGLAAGLFSVGYLYYTGVDVNTFGSPIRTSPAQIRNSISDPQRIWDGAVGLFKWAFIDPVVINIAGNGLGFSNLTSVSPSFDFKADGHPERTAWISAGTGFLTSVGQNGTVQDINDLISSFSMLETFDSNHDGIIDSSDPGFADLSLWQDANNNGISEAGEILSLASLGVASISLQYTNVLNQLSGATVVGTALATMLDGSTREIAQVELATNPMITKSTSLINTSVQDILTLPSLDGYGELDNLLIAVGNDQVLRQLVSQVASGDTRDLAAYDASLNAMLLRWAGIDTSGSSAGEVFDTQKLAFLERFFGRSGTFGGTNSNIPTHNSQAMLIESSWNLVFSGLKSRILVQLHDTPLANAFHFDPVRDLILPVTSLHDSILQLSENAPAGVGAGYFVNALRVINDSVRDVAGNQLQNTSQVLADLQGNLPSIFSPYTIQAASTGSLSIFEGYDEGTALYGAGGTNLFIVSQPNITISTQGLGDQIFIQTGASNLTIIEPRESRGVFIQMDQEFSEANLSFAGDAQQDLVAVRAGVVVFKLVGALNDANANGSETLRFSDGASLNRQQIIAVETDATANSSGELYGTSGSDLLNGQGIASVLVGNGGGDTFVFDQGYGGLEILEEDASSMSSDVLQLGPGITSAQLTVTSDAQGDMLVVVADGSDDSIKLDRMLSSTNLGVGSIRLSDGTVLTRQQLLTMANTGSTGNTSITSLLPNAVIDPEGYAHAITSSGGNSTIIYNTGYGALSINLRDSVPTDANTLQFGAGISTASVEVSSDDLGNIVLTIGTAGDTITLNAMALGPNNGVQRVSFADGTVWTAQQVVSRVSSVVANYYGTIPFNKGDGQIQASGVGVAGVQLGAAIHDGDAYIQTNASGDLVIRLRDDPSESLTVTNDIYQASGPLGQVASRVHQVFYSDGTFIDLTQGLNFTWLGDSSGHTLVGSNFAANEFDIGVGGNIIEAGNSSDGGPGRNTFVFNRGGGQATVDMNGGLGVIILGAGIGQSDVSLRSDQAGKLIVFINDTGDTLTIHGGLIQTAFGVSSPIDHIQFADGTSIQLALRSFSPQPITYSWLGVGDDNIMLGSPWGANSFIVGPGSASIVAGNGSMAGGQAGSANNIFYFDQGGGHAMVNMNGGYGQVVLAADIAPYQVMLQSTAAGDLTLALRGDPDDSITFQEDLTGQPWQNASSRIGQISFSDGSSISLGVTGLGQYSPITFNWSGTTTNTALVGSNFGANVFDLGPGGDTVTAGDGSQGGSNANTFLFGRGDGNVVVTMNGGAGTLQLDASIMRSDVRFAANAQGDITVSIKGDTADSITFLSDIYYTPFGPGSRLGAIQYGDGTTQQLGIHSYQSFMPTFTEIGTATNTVLVGSNYGDNSFEFGPAAAGGSGDTVTAGNPSQGGSGYNTFKLALGSGHVHVTLGGGYGVLQLGAGLSASDILLETNPQGDVTFAFDNNSADSVTFDGDLYNRPFGPVSAINQVLSADGSSTPIGVIGYTDHPMTFTSIGTADNTVLTGSGFGANVFDFGLSDPYGFGDTVTAGNGSQGGSGFNTFNYGPGDGNAVVDMNGGWGVLNLGGNIILADLVFQADAQGNMTVSIAGNTQDTIKFNGDLSTGPYGTVSAVNKVALSDGSSQTLDYNFWQAHPSGFS